MICLHVPCLLEVLVSLDLLGLMGFHFSRSGVEVNTMTYNSAINACRLGFEQFENSLKDSFFCDCYKEPFKI